MRSWSAWLLFLCTVINRNVACTQYFVGIARIKHILLLRKTEENNLNCAAVRLKPAFQREIAYPSLMKWIALWDDNCHISANTQNKRLFICYRQNNIHKIYPILSFCFYCQLLSLFFKKVITFREMKIKSKHFTFKQNLKKTEPILHVFNWYSIWR